MTPPSPGVTPDKDALIARLSARVAALEPLAEELISEWRPVAPGDDAWYRVPVMVTGERVAAWRAVLDGGSGEHCGTDSSVPGECLTWQG